MISIPWPVALVLGAWGWVVISVQIGNLLQREWWLGVFVFSIFGALLATVFALVAPWFI